MRRRAFSLLEVILALAILAGAVVVLGELARQGLESTRIARDLTYAQLLCESKLAELVSGVEIPEPVQDAPVALLEVPGTSSWLYSVDVVETGEEGLVSVWVTVTQDPTTERRPVRCTLVRWMLDPYADFSLPTTDTQDQSTTTTPKS